VIRGRSEHLALPQVLSQDGLSYTDEKDAHRVDILKGAPVS